MPPRVTTLTVGAFAENCYLLEDGADLAVFDPGAEPERLLAAIRETGKTPRYLFLTHAHLDHVGAVAALAEATGAPVVMSPAEAPLKANLPLQCRLFGLPPIPEFAVDRDALHGARFPFGEGEIVAIATPGHSPGGTTFRYGAHAFVGDTIFHEGVGRVDLWGGSWETLSESIRREIFTLPEHTALHPGHGGPTTAGHERANNPFFS